MITCRSLSAAVKPALLTAVLALLPVLHGCGGTEDSKPPRDAPQEQTDAAPLPATPESETTTGSGAATDPVPESEPETEPGPEPVAESPLARALRLGDARQVTDERELIDATLTQIESDRNMLQADIRQVFGLAPNGSATLDSLSPCLLYTSPSPRDS